MTPRAIVHAFAIGVTFAVASACASAGAPPGGPPDLKPPHLLRASPDSGAVRIKPRDVEFEFDEVLSEMPRGAPDLAQIVLVSPSDGDPIVEWHRTRITVHPRHGWRVNTTYVVTLLPGLMDLRNNMRDSTNVLVFSTGDSIPGTLVMGTVFDWSKGAAAARAFIEAHPVGDTTVAFPTKADSVGRFVLPFLNPGDYMVRAILDANNNRRLDPREAWDSVRVRVRDVSSVELYAFQHDTMIGPRISTVVVVDSMTLRITFDQPLSPAPGYLPVLELRAALDSTIIEAVRILPWTALAARRDSIERVRKDSIARADTNSAQRERRELAMRDSTERAAAIADSIAHDTTKRVLPPKSKRPALITEIGVELRRPLVEGAKNSVRAKAVGVLGAERNTERAFSRPKPPPAPPAARRPDTSSVPPRASPPARP